MNPFTIGKKTALQNTNSPVNVLGEELCFRMHIKFDR